MRTLQVSLEDVVIAMCYGDNEETGFWLDLESGEVQSVTWAAQKSVAEGTVEDVLDEWDAEQVALARDIAAQPERFMCIEPRGMVEKMRDRVQFAGTLADKALREQLLDALDDRSAFSLFGRVLEAHPKEMQRWLDYEQAREQEAAVAFLHDKGIDPQP